MEMVNSPWAPSRRSSLEKIYGPLATNAQSLAERLPNANGQDGCVENGAANVHGVAQKTTEGKKQVQTFQKTGAG